MTTPAIQSIITCPHCGESILLMDPPPPPGTVPPTSPQEDPEPDPLATLHE